jgi:predicted transcriptional regulator of viral defense system
MTADERLDLLFEQNNGILKTAQVLESGISKPVFYAYVKLRGVEQAAHGVYVSPEAWTDAMYLLHLRCAQAVFSHESALFFHDLTDREPSPYSITVKTGYNPACLQADGIKVYTIKKELHDVGITTMNTPFGNPVFVYDMERTVCDLVRSRSGIEVQTFSDALRRYAKRKDKDLRKLMRYAQMFHVEKLLRQYLEVLL